MLQNNDNIEKNPSAFYCTRITLNRRHLHYFLENPLMLPSLACICEDEAQLTQIFGIKSI